ncbi:Sister chromatid cohesion protein DCC1 [Purpureocillium lavendulum]|uniref:Sister chromatid cohesion protein DCC1 n=1 Tax=Purpureocillium lavendulum TaxID=1247861 RepID=A0AB34G795_9HYPO|nr:Sister chromatid cohesion protein DCC1 [Purpureocillium lavendulum]
MPPSSQRDALCDFPGQGECPRGLLRYREALNGIKKTVFSHAEEFFGYQLECDLTEPGLALWEVQQSATMQQRDLQSIGQCILTEHDIIRWIASFKQHLAIQSTIVRDEDQLFMLADLIRKSMIQQSGDELAPMLNRLGVSMDCASLLLGILSLGALCSGDYPKGHIFFEESRRLLDDYAGEPTFDLCLAVHLHHIYILMTGTSNRARAVACFNVQIAHDLGLDQKQDAPENISGLRLYLLIMMSDQYSAQTHGTKPVISASSLKDDLFDPLVQVEPEVLPLLQLMKANSLSLEALVEKDFARDNVVDLEAKIDRASISTQRFDPSNCSPTSFGKLYWPVARLHMFWYRLLLRSPFLSEEVGWLTSLSICLHAAEMILSSYFEMAYPALKAGPLQGIVSHTVEVQDGIRSGKFTVQQYARDLIRRYEDRDGDIHAWVYFDKQAILSRAKALDAIPAEARGPLHGVAIGIKDNLLTRGYLEDKDNLHETLRSLVERRQVPGKADILDAHNKVAALRQEWDNIAAEYDAVITPSVIGEAPEGLENTGSAAFNTLWTMLHAPTLNVPGFEGENGMPVGLTLVGGRYTDMEVLRAGQAIGEILSKAEHRG